MEFGSEAQDPRPFRHSRGQGKHRELRLRRLRRLRPFGRFHANLQVVPCRLSGHRIGIGIAVAPVALWQQFVDQMVEQKPLSGFGRPGVQVPRSGPLADGIPGPYRVAVHPFH